jgi:hypothetical protein
MKDLLSFVGLLLILMENRVVWGDGVRGALHVFGSVSVTPSALVHVWFN